MINIYIVIGASPTRLLRRPCRQAVNRFRLIFAYTADSMFDPFVDMPRPNRSLIYFGACIIAGLRLARERQVNVRVIPTSVAINESVDLAHEIFNRVFRKVPERMEPMN